MLSVGCSVQLNIAFAFTEVDNEVDNDVKNRPFQATNNISWKKKLKATHINKIFIIHKIQFFLDEFGL